MGLNIVRGKGNLNLVVSTDDACIAMVFTGTAVAGKVALLEPKQVYSIDALTDLGITEANNPVAFRDITDFYAKAGEGAELNFMLVSDATLLPDLCNKNNNIATTLLDFTQGRAAVLLINYKPAAGYTVTPQDGLAQDFWSSVENANNLAKEYIDNDIPLVIALPGFGFDKDEVANMPTRQSLTFDNVAANLHCEANDKHVSMGLLAGWIAKHQVHLNIGQVISGKMSNTAYFPDGTTYNILKSSIAAIAGKGFIVPTKRGQKAGYFYFDDPTLTATTNVYSSISWNRVINKVHRIASEVLLEKLNADVPLDEATGKIETTIAADWESDVENAVKVAMMKQTATTAKEFSGIKCTVSTDSDIANNEVDATIEVVRNGQSKTINVTIQYSSSI